MFFQIRNRPSTLKVSPVRIAVSVAPMETQEREIARIETRTRARDGKRYTAEIRLRRAVHILAPIVLVVAGTAAANSGVPDSMRACVQEQDDGRRLACYDREMARAEKSYGLTDEQKRKLDPPKVSVEVQAQPLSSKVVTVTLRADGRNVIALENGQIWVQGDAFEDIAIHTGDTVTIKSGLLGAFYMYLPSKLRTRVTRRR